MTMNRENLIEGVHRMLVDCGFSVSDPISLKGIAFDLIARRDEEILILKILQNIDAFNKDDAAQMRVLSGAIHGKNAVIGARNSSRKLDDGIVYSRFGIPIMTADTLQEFLKEGVPPLIFAAPGGLYVKIDSDLLKSIRQERNISLGTLAEIAGVSRKAIQMYEDGMGAMVDVAMKIEEFLNEPIVVPLNPFELLQDAERIMERFEDKDRLHSEVFRMFEGMGYDVQPTARCPFEAVTTDEKVMLLTGVERYGPNLERKANVVASISKVVEQKAVIITDKDSKIKTLRTTALISRDELAGVDHDEVLDLIRERSKEKRKGG